MDKKVGRNDPCPCGSGKKYKSCCASKHQSTGTKKFTAKVLSGEQKQMAAPKNLIEQTFSFALAGSKKNEPYHQPTQEEMNKEVPIAGTNEDPMSSSPI